jgi:hypothetical protein
MAGTLIIFEEDASHAIQCAEFLARMAEKHAKGEPLVATDGDAEDVANNLKDVIAVLKGGTIYPKRT